MGLFDFLRKRSSACSGSSVDCYSFKGSPEKYFEKLFAEHFPEYTIERNVRMNLSSEDAVPVSFLLCKDGRQRLAVILCNSQEYKRSCIMNTIRACEALGIPTQRYFTDFRNELNYVCQRVGQALQ